MSVRKTCPVPADLNSAVVEWVPAAEDAPGSETGYALGRLLSASNPSVCAWEWKCVERPAWGCMCRAVRVPTVRAHPAVVAFQVADHGGVRRMAVCAVCVGVEEFKVCRIVECQ